MALAHIVVAAGIAALARTASAVRIAPAAVGRTAAGADKMQAAEERPPEHLVPAAAEAPGPHLSLSNPGIRRRPVGLHGHTEGKST